MIVDLVFTVLMLILPVVLWIVPKTRRNNGNWLIALKTVPLGIIVCYWCGELLSKIAWIISERQERDFEFPIWVYLAVALTVVFLIIIPGGLFIKWKFGTEKKYNPGPSVLLFFLFWPPALLCLLILSFACDLSDELSVDRGHVRFAFRHKEDWHNIWLPREGTTGIAFQKQPIHPFLAEYNYRIRFSRDGEKTYWYLLMNTGRQTIFYLYRLKDGRLFFRYYDCDYLVDVQGPECRVLRLEPFEDKLYAAQVPNKEYDSWSGPFRKNDEIVMEMGDQTFPAEDVTGILDGMTYYGRIRDHFDPRSLPVQSGAAEEKPEQEIEKKFEKPEGEDSSHRSEQTNIPEEMK